jgi:hypothetical protein
VTDDEVEVLDGAEIISLDVTEAAKKITVRQSEAGVQRDINAHWFIDAAGRQALLKNHLGLAQDNAHRGNALWFRVDKQIKLDEWSTDPDWQARTKSANTRWLSTNHLMGPGYWVWIIPLDNGATSIGIVMDDEAFASHDFSNLESTLQWLHQHHPHCAGAIADAEVLDYVVIRDYSHGCRQMFSEHGWGVSGESGVFADPFYSPGTDFIAFNNTFINDLIQKSHRGEDIRFASRLYQGMNQSFFDSTLSLYTGEYGGFGDRRMMGLKLVWDYAYYWGVLSLLFFRSAMTNIPVMRELNPTLWHAQDLNSQVQSAFRQRAQKRLVLPAQGLFLNQYELPCLKHLNNVLEDESADVSKTLPDNVELLTRLARHVQSMLADDASTQADDGERELLGDYRRSILA